MNSPFKIFGAARRARVARAEEAYLNGAVDLIDLEYRERELDRRQRRNNMTGRQFL